MTEQQALQILADAVGNIDTKRAIHEQFVIAVRTLEKLLPKTELTEVKQPKEIKPKVDAK